MIRALAYLVFSSVAALTLNAQAGAYVLVPVAVPSTTPGAFASMWKSELWAYNGTAEALMVPHTICAFPPCIGPISPGKTTQYPADALQSPVGAILLAIPAEARHKVTFSNRLFELSRRAQPAGVDVPTVLDVDFFNAPVRFVGIRNEDAQRVSVRVYHPVAFGSGGAVRLDFVRTDGVVITSTTLNMQYFNDSAVPGFAAIYDVAGTFPEVRTAGRYDIVVTPLAPAELKYYAIASVTDNDTQQVLVISTQQ